MREHLLFEGIYEDIALCSVRGPGCVLCIHHAEDDMVWLWLPVTEFSWEDSEWPAKMLETGTTGVVMRGVSELLPVCES